MTATEAFTTAAAQIAQDLIAKGATPEAATVAAVDYLLPKFVARFGQ